ncbi:MAG: hypothetical protein ACR2MY_13365 [Candidatus Dormibacteria bacterium]
MRRRLLSFLEQPELADEGILRLFAGLLMAAAGLFFFRFQAVPVLVACVVGGGLVISGLWAGFHRLGVRQVGAYIPGTARGMAVAILAFCLMPPGIPPLLAGLLAAFAVGVEAVQRRALVPLALSGVTAAWLLAWIWQARTGSTFIAPFDFHPLDEPVTLWVKFQTAIDPVRTYAGQVAGPLGATSVGLVAIATVLVSYARGVSWYLVLSFYLPVLLVALVGHLPLNVYLLNAPALAFVGLVAADPRHLPRTVAWRLITGFVGGAVASTLLLAGSGYQAFGVGVAASTLLVTVFQFFGMAGSPGVLELRQQEPQGEAEPAPDPVRRPRTTGRRSPAQLAALAAFMPVGLAMVSRDRSLERSQRSALVVMGIALYALSLAASLTWLWLLRLPR